VVVVAQEVGAARAESVGMGIEERPEPKVVVGKIPVVIGQLVVAAVDGVAHLLGTQGGQFQRKIYLGLAKELGRLVGNGGASFFHARLIGGILQGETNLGQAGFFGE